MTLIRFHNQPLTGYPANRSYNSKEQSGCGCTVPSNIIRTGEAIIAELSVPGFNKEDFNISLEHQELKITAKGGEQEQNEDRYLKREFFRSDVSKSFIIPKTVDAESISADYKNGILRVEMPLKKEAKITREIRIN
ncbi:MAG TPA: Hsp20/alpha crystallin family protein [Lentimicrobium sp.]|jgi:HSP20 family protein|nr:Hsp20/alpha crystallin family protein [Lentimicrobium sp.]